MLANSGLAAYQQARQATLVEGASAYQLTSMLMEGALQNIVIARGQMTHGDLAGKGESVSRTIDILDELIGNLNMEAGGELAQNLMAIYEYSKHCLLEGSLLNDATKLDEAAALIGTVHEGWQGIPEGDRA